ILNLLSPRVVTARVDEVVGNVKGEDGEGLGALPLQLGREDARIGEGVAVDLCRYRLRGAAVCRGVVCGLQLTVGFVDVERAAECGGGVDGGVAQAGEPTEYEVHLHLRTGEGVG